MEKVEKNIEKCSNMSEAIYSLCKDKKFTCAEMFIVLGMTFTEVIESNYESRLWMLKFEEIANKIRLVLAKDALQQNEDDKEVEEEEEE